MFRRINRNSKRIQARKLFDYNIILIGFMGAGKTSISDYLNTMFAMDIVEMDQVIADRGGDEHPRYLCHVRGGVFPESGDRAPDRDAVPEEHRHLLRGRAWPCGSGI